MGEVRHEVFQKWVVSIRLEVRHTHNTVGGIIITADIATPEALLRLRQRYKSLTCDRLDDAATPPPRSKAAALSPV